MAFGLTDLLATWSRSCDLLLFLSKLLSVLPPDSDSELLGDRAEVNYAKLITLSIY